MLSMHSAGCCIALCFLVTVLADLWHSKCHLLVEDKTIGMAVQKSEQTVYEQ